MTSKAFLAFLTNDPRRFFRWVQCAALAALAALDVALLASTGTPTGTLQIRMRSSVASQVQVYFDTGHGFVEDESKFQPVTAGPEAQTLEFVLPARPVRRVRIDPLEVAGTVNIHSVRVVRDGGHVEARVFDLESLEAGREIGSLTPNIEGLEVVTLPDSKDSQLGLPLDRPIDLRLTAWQWIIRFVAVDGLLFLLFYALSSVAFFGWPRRPFALPRSEPLRFLVRRWFPDRWSALAFTAPLACFGCYLAASQQGSYHLEMVLQSDRPATTQFYFDAGQGYSEGLSSRVKVEAGDKFQTVRVPIPVRTIRALRFDPAEGPVAMRVNSVAIRSDAEDWLGLPPYFSFDLHTLLPLFQLKELVHERDGTIRLLVEDGADNPVTALTLPAPVTMGLHGTYVFLGLLAATAGWLLLWGLLAEARFYLPASAAGTVEREIARAQAAWRRLPPARAVWLVAGASVVLSCYPVIFCGKSFCSPNFAEGTYQLYQKFPTLPGTTDTALENGRGADVFTMAWQTAPAAVVESRALFHHGELPLWNRYEDGGLPLLGQGQSMMGDPLHLIVLLAGGRAWAWDLKFLLAKWLFTAGVGLLVLTAADSLPVALLLCFSSAFIGFFSYRLNHPAFFSLCYAPWIVLAWLRIAEAVSWRRAAAWMGGLILANWMEVNSGSVAEAYALVLCLNLYGLWMLLLSRHSAEYRFRRLFGVAAAGGVFCLLISPLLLAFTATLKHAAEPGTAGIRQLSPGLLIGLFDDIFYRQLTFNEDHLAPSANFLVLLGVLVALGGAGRLLGNRTFVAALLGAAFPLALVFKALPPGMVRALAPAVLVPRPGTAFSGALFLPLFVLAGFGLKQCLAQPSRPRWLRGLVPAAVVGVALLGIFLGLMATAGRGGLAALKPGPGPDFSVFFQCYVPVLIAATVLLPFVLRRLWLRGPAPLTVLLLAGCLFVIHWRQGIQLHGALSRYTPVLPGRVDLLARSPAIDFLHADDSGPFRAVGLGANLMTGYNAVAEVEGIDSRDALVSPYFSDLKSVGLQFSGDWLASAMDTRRLAVARRFYNLLNVRYYLSLPGGSLADVPGLPLIGRLDLDVYRNNDAWPRAFFVDRLEEYTGPYEFARHVAEGDPLPFAAVDVSEYGLHPELNRRFQPGREGRTVVPAENYRLTSNRTAFDVNAPGAGVIVLSEGYERECTASVNGRRVPVFRVNHAFKGIWVDGPGSYHVAFGYQPAGFTLALWTSALGWVFLGAAGWWLYRTRGDTAPRRKSLIAPPGLL